MIELWGLRWDEQYPFSRYLMPEETRDLVATFDTMEAARDYVKSSLLKAAKEDQYFSADPHRGKFKYRKNSLLRWYTDCEIERAEEPVPPPHNPTLED